MANENGQEKRETLADIVALMRHDAELCHDIWLNDPDNNSQSENICGILNGYADRIEAAWRRDEERAVEHATRHAEAVARDNCRDCIHNPNGKNYEHVGNAAAMREALVKIRDIIMGGGFDGRSPAYIVNICDAALSAPARNCDMYATYAEAAEAHKEYATAYIMRASNKFDFPMEFDEWLFAPAAERKGDGDGR